MGYVRSGAAHTAERLTRRGPWVILAFGVVWIPLVGRVAPAVGSTVLTVSLAVFFVLLLARLALTAARQPRRRRGLLLLAGAVLLWAGGSMSLNGGGQPDLTHFPAPGELMFLAAYAGIAGYLVLDARRRGGTLGASGLEAVVVCGGAASLAGAVLLTPDAQRLGADGLPLLLALLYPLIDIVLALLVVAQVTLGTRRLSEIAATLTGLAMWAVADAGFVDHLASGTYVFSTVSVDLWGAGFALLVADACRPRNVTLPPASATGPTGLVVAAGMVASLVLAFEPVGAIRSYLVLPALVTLVAAGVRLGLALRAASRAAEAFALSRSDDLTDLPNRRALLQAVDRDLAQGRPLGLMILDLDGFKDVNDTLGHAAGDAVLCEVAGRIRGALDPSVTVARLGGDEFAIRAPVDDELVLMELAQHVLRAVRLPVLVDGIALPPNASIGITVRTPADTASSELLRRADVAMYDAKRRRAGALLYDADSDGFSVARLRLADELRRAIAERQLEVWYQPQLATAGGELCGLEALVRWRHPVHGVLTPAAFLPIARRTGLMQALSDEIGRLVVEHLQAWRGDGLQPRVAVNCAPPELLGGLFLPALQRRLETAGIDPSRITVEVTEDSFISEPHRARTVMLDLRQRGFSLSIDDYGTGFSSLSYLRDLPVDELKIDRSFVAGICDDANNRAIVASTVQLAAALRLRVVAEGVEDARTAAELMALGVDVLQGYHLSRPLPAREVVGWSRQIERLLA